MNTKMKSILKSYLRGVLVALMPLLATNTTDYRAYIVAVSAGVISPALRALDKSDPAFGVVADIVEVETAVIAKKIVKKTTPTK